MTYHIVRGALAVLFASASVACSASAIDAVLARGGGGAGTDTGAVDAGPHAPPKHDAGSDAAVVVATGPGYHTDGNTLRDPSGNVVHLRAVTWYGLEQDGNPHGLGSLELSAVIAQMKSIGFNTLRMTWSSGMLAKAATVASINYNVNPALSGITTPLGLLDAVIASAGTQGMNVILSRRRPSADFQSDLWYDKNFTEDDFVEDWTTLARRYANDATVIGCDLESDVRGKADWGGDDTVNDWRRAAERAGNAILAVNANVLIFVGGVETVDANAYWRGGNLRGVATKPVNLVAPNRLVYATEDFPATANDAPPPGGAPPWFASASYPANLPSVWDANWGFVFEQNLAPVFLMGFGTRYVEDSDKKWLASLVQYVEKYDLGFAYFALNQESADVGGLYTSYGPPGVLDTELVTALKPILTQ